MKKNVRASTPNRESIEASDIPIVLTTQNDEGKDTLNFSCGGLSTRRGGNMNLSGHFIAALAPSSLNLSTQKLRFPNHIKHNSLAVSSHDFSGLRQRDNSNSHLLLSDIMGSSPFFSNLGFEKNINSNLRNTEISERDDNSSNEFIEPLGIVFKNSCVKPGDISRTTRDRSRNKSIPNSASSSDLLTLTSKTPSVTGSKRNSFSQAYTKAMKALQDRIKHLEAKVKDDNTTKLQKASGKQEGDSVVAQHEIEIAQFAQYERIHREKAEMLEKKNMELNMKIKALEEDKAHITKQFKELLNEKVQVEERYKKMVNEKTTFHNAYQEIENAVEKMQRELEVALRKEKNLQEKLQQNMIEAAHEKDVLKNKNATLTEAFMKIEKDYSECKKMYNQRLEELITKNGALEKELQLVKINYSQQIKDFDNELREIEKSQAKKIEEYENKIDSLTTRLSEFESLDQQKYHSVKPLKENNVIQSIEFKSMRKSSLTNTENLNPLRTSISRSQSPFSPRNITKENESLENEYMPRIDLIGRRDQKNNVYENDIEVMSNTTTRNRYSQRIGSSDYSALSEKMTYQQNRINSRSRDRLLNLTDLTDKENINVWSHKNSSLKTPTVNKEIQGDFYDYICSSNVNSKILTPTNKDNMHYIDLTQPFILRDSKNGILEPRESANFQKNISFGNPETLHEKHEESNILLDTSNLRDASTILIKKHRESLINSIKDSTLSPSNNLLPALEGKMVTKEKETSKLNENYQDLMKRIKGTVDPKERSGMRAQLIKLTEQMQKVNESTYQFKKHIDGFKG